jgi:hypothetical protein
MAGSLGLLPSSFSVPHDGKVHVAGIQSFQKETSGGYSSQVRNLNLGHFGFDSEIRFISHKIRRILIFLTYCLWVQQHTERLKKAWLLPLPNV